MLAKGVLCVLHGWGQVLPDGDLSWRLSDGVRADRNCIAFPMSYHVARHAIRNHKLALPRPMGEVEACASCLEDNVGN